MPSPHVTYQAFTQQHAPKVYAAMGALGQAVAASGLDKALIELVKLRVSQINACAFCLQFHLGLARKLGIEAQKLDLLAAWRDAGVFSAREEAALAWAEQLTRLGPDGLPHDAWERLRDHFSETEAIFLTTAIGQINTWNRIGIGLRFAPSAA